MLHGTHIHGDIYICYTHTVYICYTHTVYICYTHRVHMDLPPRPEAEQQA